MKHFRTRALSPLLTATIGKDARNVTGYAALAGG